MSDLIRREDVKKFVCKNCVCKKLDEPCDGDCAMLRNVDNIPSADAVEVVRCDTCEYYKPYDIYDGKIGSCRKNGRMFMGRNEYCSKGVRKEESIHAEEPESND